MTFQTFNEAIAQAKNKPPVHVSVAAAHDRDVLLAIKEALELNMIVPHLVGDAAKIDVLCREIGLPLEQVRIYDVSDDITASYEAARLAHNGQCQVVMKGFVNSTQFLKGILSKDLNLKTGRLLSHLSIFEIPAIDKLIYMTDGGLNIHPDVTQKAEIIINATQFLKHLGVTNPNVALLAANEQVSDMMPVTTESKAVIKEIEDAGFTDEMIVEGPLPLDLAISHESLVHKGIESKIDGKADLLVVPNIEAGNIMGKTITYFAKGTMAGVVLGAKVPLVLVSRSDSPRAKLASLAFSSLAVPKGDVLLDQPLRKDVCHHV